MKKLQLYNKGYTIYASFNSNGMFNNYFNQKCISSLIYGLNSLHAQYKQMQSISSRN